MQAPPGPSGPQLSPDGNYWWDGARWVPMQQPVRQQWQPPAYTPQQWQPPPPYMQQWQPPPYRPPAPSPGLRPFLIVVMIVSSVLTGLLAVAGVLALLDYISSPQDADTGAIVLIVIFEVLFALVLTATLGAALRARWARVVTIVAGAALCLTCVGAVLGIPIIVAGARAPMSKPAPGGYT